MDTIAQALELKISGYTAFAPDGAGGEMGSLVFVDDAANAAGEAFFLDRITLFWSIWSRITDCQLNIKGNNKTVVQSLEYKRGRDGTLIPIETRKKFYIAALVDGDLPRRIPNLLVSEHYLYCGMATRMDGRHNEVGLSTLRSKITACGAQAATSSMSRRLALGCAGLSINGNAFFYGACFGGSFEAVEGTLGPACRRVLQQKGVKGFRRSYSSPRVQLHASPRGISTSVNDDLSQLFVAAAGPAAHISGYGNVHVWPAMMAASLMTLVNALASPVCTPAADRAHHAVARVLWSYGLESVLRSFYELVPVLLGIIHSDSYRTNPSNFWSGCLHARALAQLFIGDSELIPSVDALTVLRIMRAQGVDWLQWLTARPEDSRRTLHHDDDDGDDESDPRIAPNQSADDRFATLSERREFLRVDDEACQRLTDTLRELLDRDQSRGAALRMLHWLHEGDVLSDVRDGTTSSAVSSPLHQRDVGTPDSPSASPQPLAANAMNSAMPRPIAASWQREPMLAVDYPASCLSPALLSREQLRPPLLTDEACRIARCTDAFGVLLVGLSARAPPTDTDIHRAFCEAKARLEIAQARLERGVTVRHPRCPSPSTSPGSHGNRKLVLGGS